MYDRLPEPYVQQLVDQADVDVQDEEVIKHFRNWCVQQFPYLPETFYDDKLLTNFILFSKRLETAKEKIIGYYRAKIEYPDYFLALDPTDENTKKTFSSWYAELLPKLTADGFRVYFIRFIGEPENFILRDFNKYINMTSVAYLREYIPHRSLILVVDLNGIRLQHVAAFTPYVFKILNIHIKVNPTMIESLIYINTPIYFTKIVSFGVNLLKDKIKERVFIYSGGYENLLNHIPQYVLPIELGGTADYSLVDVKENNYKYLVENRQLFLKEINTLQKYIEQSKEEDKCNSELAIDDIHGTFRKLDID